MSRAFSVSRRNVPRHAEACPPVEDKESLGTHSRDKSNRDDQHPPRRVTRDIQPIRGRWPTDSRILMSHLRTKPVGLDLIVEAALV